MGKLKIFLLVNLTFVCFSTMAYAKCQIQYDFEANRVLHLGGNTLRGNFSTLNKCEAYRRSRPYFEQSHSKCVGCRRSDGYNSSQQNSMTTNILNDKGIQAYRAGNFKAAVYYFKQALRKSPNDQTIRKNLRRAKNALARARKAARKRDEKNRAVQKRNDQKRNDQRKKERQQKQLDKQKKQQFRVKNQASTNEDQLQQAEQRLTELRDDVKTMQFALQVYQDGLLKNVTSLDRQSREIGKMSNKILFDGVKYMRSLASSHFLKKAKLKFMSKEQQKKYDDVIELIEKLKQIKDKKEFLSWFANSPSDTRKLIEGADMLAGDVLPGWEHVKMNFKAWSTVGKEAVAWLEINRINRGTEDYSLEVKAISLEMKRTVEEINCMKRCIAESAVGCIQECSY